MDAKWIELLFSCDDKLKMLQSLIINCNANDYVNELNEKISAIKPNDSD